VVPLFLDDETREWARRSAATFPPASEMVKVRTWYFDRAMGRALSEGIRQVVILGSGLDTRAVRLAREGVRFFEIDDGRTLRLKEERLADVGLRPDARFIAGDYLSDDLLDRLRAAGCDPGRPAYVLWEGNTTYLPPEDVMSLLGVVAGAFRDLTISFDYMSGKVITRTTGHDDLDAYIDHLASIGAPWRSGFDDIKAVAEDAGLSLVESFSASELFQRCRGAASPPSPIFDHYFVCTMRSAP
jgi:methyltransferase (TIGR00027 family)